MSPLSSLPDEVLKLVMQHVPLRHRLTACCLVNRRLHAAAVAATDRLDVLCDNVEQLYDPTEQIRMKPYDSVSLLQWGQHVTSLCLRMFPEPLQEAPCQNLRQLKLKGGSIQLAAADGQPGVIHGCSKLARLKLACAITDARQGAVIKSLSNLVHLQHLVVEPLRSTVGLSTRWEVCPVQPCHI